MTQKKYVSRIDKPTVYTTSKGGRIVRPFDILRSKTGRAAIDRLAKIEVESASTEKKIEVISESRQPGGSDK